MARRYHYSNRYRYDTYDYEDNNLGLGCLKSIFFGICLFFFAPVIFTGISFLSDLIFNPKVIMDSVPKNLRGLPESLAILPDKIPRIVSLIEAKKVLSHDIIVSKEVQPLPMKDNQEFSLLPEREEPPDKCVIRASPGSSFLFLKILFLC